MADPQDRDADVSRADGEGLGNDMERRTQIGFRGEDSAEDQEHTEMRHRHNAHDRAHVDLTKDEYTPDEVARMIGTSLQVVMHAIRTGELKADRQGQSVVCITHEAVTDWLRRRGPGV